MSPRHRPPSTAPARSRDVRTVDDVLRFFDEIMADVIRAAEMNMLAGNVDPDDIDQVLAH
jgi:hypothetical protein